MAVVECFVADGDKFTFVVGRAGGFGKPSYLGTPELIGYSRHHSLDIGFQALIVLQRDPLSILGVILNIFESVFSTE